jgi:cytochrome c-type biogenesis protein CcmF
VIAEIGHFALALALIMALAQATYPILGAQRGNALWMAAAEPAAMAQFGFTSLAFAALTYLYVTSDFSVANVAANSNSALPMLYKVTGTWGNHEGSMVLWVFMLSLFGLAVALFGRNLPPGLRARVLSVQGMVGTGFLLFILLTSNPFLRLHPAPADGRDLNPILQDPGLVFHPPFLYLGYVGFSMAFSFAVAALIEGRVDAAWARWVRPWTLAAWISLTLGIALGSWWAYYELGWGGWWFWDPVENASFMPWLAGTALLHSSIVVEKRDALKNWTILLAIITFSLSLIGTFLVRSGVLTSVHAFATDPERGLFILLLLVITIGAALALFAARAPTLKTGGLFAPISREGSLVLNNLLLATAAVTVLIGTLYPLLMDALGMGKVSVGAPYFNATFVPLIVPMIMIMGVGPFLRWKRADLAGALGRLKLAFAATAVVTLAAWYAHSQGPVLALVGIALAAWLFTSTAVEYADRIGLFRVPLTESARRAARLPRAAYGMTIAHIGLAVAIAGMVGTSAWKEEHIQLMQPGETVEVAGYTLTFQGARMIDGPNYSAAQGRFEVRREGRDIAVLLPEKRFYPVQETTTTEAAIHTTILADLYAVIGDPGEGGAWVTRIFHHPLVPWIWAGAVVMVLGGIVSLTDRRYRVGAPVRRLRPAAAAARGRRRPARA